MTKPTIYFDTNIISSYWYPGKDPAGIIRRAITRDWWAIERGEFDIWLSMATESELTDGEFRHQKNCLRFARRINYLPMTAAVDRFADALAEHRIVPSEKPVDATQMSVCAVHGIDYLLSWNYAHLVNPVASAATTLGTGVK